MEANCPSRMWCRAKRVVVRLVIGIRPLWTAHNPFGFDLDLSRMSFPFAVDIRK